MTTLPLNPIEELIDALSGKRGAIAVIAGAGISMPAPARLPGAQAWKTELLRGVAKRANLGLNDLGNPELRRHSDELSHLGQPWDIKMEAVFQALDDAQPRLAYRLVHCVVDNATPNRIHEKLAQGLIRGDISTVVTPNFDELVEAAASSHGWTTTQWVTGQSPKTSQLLHVHGTAAMPTSLRHTLNRFDLRLPPDEHRLVTNALRGEVVTLGWSATDTDLLSALAEGSGAVRVLLAGSAPDPETRRTLESLASKRPVTLHPGGFNLVFGPQDFTGGRHTEVGPTGTTPTEELIKGLSVAKARRVLAHLSFRYSLRQNASKSLVLNAWAGQRLREDAEDAVMYRRSRIESQQASGKTISATITQALIWRATKDPHDLSALGDVSERIGRGLNPLKRVLALPIHLVAVRQQARRGIVDPFARARLARACHGIGMHRGAARQLNLAFEAIDEDSSDLWVRAHLHRLRAVSNVYLNPLSDWQPDIATALELFRFDNRPLEIGNTYRTKAVCHLLSGEGDWRQEAEDCLRRTEDHYQEVADSSAFALLRLQRLITRCPRRLARVLAAFL